MRFAALALILLSLPVFVALLRRYPARREWALTATGVLLFCVGPISPDAALYSLAMWPGIAKGFMLSPIDTLSLALILTRSRPKAQVHYAWLVIVFMIPSALSVFVSSSPVSTLLVPIQIARVALMTYALAGELHSPAALRSLFTGVAGGLLIQAGFVIEQKLSGVLQARGTADHQNILGLMVEAAVIPLFALMLEGERRKFVYAGLAAGLIIIAGGGSRATMVMVPIALFVLLVLSIFRRSSPHKLKILGMLLVASAVTIPLGLATLGDRFGDSSMSVEKDARWPFERAARMMSADHPFGVGANNYVTVANTEGYYRRAGVDWGGNNLAAPVHNSYLLMRAENGWLGQIVMIAVLVVPLVGGFVLAFTNRRVPMAGMGLGASVAITAILVHINFEYAWHLESVQRVFFLNFAILSGAVEASRRARRQSRVRMVAQTAPMPSQAGGNPSGGSENCSRSG